MSLLQDLRFAVRLLVKDRWFTAVAVVALALGIGVNATVFTFVNAVLIRGLPFDDPDRIVVDRRRATHATATAACRISTSRTGARRRARFSALAAVQRRDDERQRRGARRRSSFSGAYMSANMFQLIGQRPLLGRDFRPEDDRPGAAPVVILGNGIWKNRYGSDPAIIGRDDQGQRRAVRRSSA